MIDLRIVNNVPHQAASIAHVEVPNVTVRDNISLLDYASQNAENSIGFYNSRGITQALPPTTLIIPPSTVGMSTLLTDDLVLGNRSVLSKGVTFGESLFYRTYLGRGPAIRVVADTGTVAITVDATSVSYSTTSITYTDKSTRRIVKEINEAADGIKAQLLTPTTADFTTGSFSATAASGIALYNKTYHRVYSPNASTTDLEAARDTIKQSVDVLVDGKKTNELSWDIWVDKYETNGFIVALYLDRQTATGKTFQVRFNAIDQNGKVSQSRIEIINSEPYLAESIDYTIVEDRPAWKIDELATSDYAWGIGLFSRTGSNISLTVSSTTLDASPFMTGGTALTYTSMTINDIVAKINEEHGSNLTATVLSSDLGSLSADSLVSGAYTVYPSGTPIPINTGVTFLTSPESRIHPLLPYDEEPRKPWYPRIRHGKFSEFRELGSGAYGINFGFNYGGSFKELYTYSIPEYTNMPFATALGAPYRHMALEPPIIISDTILRTRRFPLESLANIILYDGDEIITSSITDVDLNQGFIYLSERLSSYEDLHIAYMYKELSYMYTGINLNPHDNKDMIGRFVGIYCIPSRVGINLWEETNRTVYHVVMDTVADIISSLSTLSFTVGTIAVNPLLVGIYQVVPTAGTDDVVLRSVPIRGGGIKEDVDPSRDAQFVWDFGRWDGEPFEDQGSVVIEMPASSMAAPSPSTQFYYDPVASTQTFMTNNKLWTQEEVENIGQRWAALGHISIMETGS